MAGDHLASWRATSRQPRYPGPQESQWVIDGHLGNKGSWIRVRSRGQQVNWSPRARNRRPRWQSWWRSQACPIGCLPTFS